MSQFRTNLLMYSEESDVKVDLSENCQNEKIQTYTSPPTQPPAPPYFQLPTQTQSPRARLTFHSPEPRYITPPYIASPPPLSAVNFYGRHQHTKQHDQQKLEFWKNNCYDFRIIHNDTNSDNKHNEDNNSTTTLSSTTATITSQQQQQSQPHNQQLQQLQQQQQHQRQRQRQRRQGQRRQQQHQQQQQQHNDNNSDNYNNNDNKKKKEKYMKIR